MSGEGIFQSIMTTLRGRVILGGSFTTANTSAPTSPKGDGTVARTGTGVFTVTLPKKYKTCESLIPIIDNAANSGVTVSAAYSSTTGVITVTVIVSAAAADTTGRTVNWFMVATGRT